MTSSETDITAHGILVTQHEGRRGQRYLSRCETAEIGDFVFVVRWPPIFLHLLMSDTQPMPRLPSIEHGRIVRVLPDRSASMVLLDDEAHPELLETDLLFHERSEAVQYARTTVQRAIEFFASVERLLARSMH